MGWKWGWPWALGGALLRTRARVTSRPPPWRGVALIVPPMPLTRRRTTVSPRPLPGLSLALASRVRGFKHGEAVLAGEDRAPVGHLNQELLLARVDRDLNGLLTITVFGAVFDQIFNDLV